MKRYRVVIFALAISWASANAFGFADCTRPIQSVWTGYDGARIYIKYSDGFSGAAMSLDYVNNDEQVVNRTLAAILAAQLAGRTVTFRYDAGQDGSPATCTPGVAQKLSGVWVN